MDTYVSKKQTERIRNFKKKQSVVFKRILPFNKIDRIKFYQQKKTTTSDERLFYIPLNFFFAKQKLSQGSLSHPHFTPSADVRSDGNVLVAMNSNCQVFDVIFRGVILADVTVNREGLKTKANMHCAHSIRACVVAWRCG